MAGLTTGEKSYRICMFIRFQTIHEHDRQIDGQTDILPPHDGIGLSYA